MLREMRWWRVCAFCVVVDHSLVENGQQASYGPCGAGAVGRVDSEEVCIAACWCSGPCYCAGVSTHDALAAIYAAERTCSVACSGAPLGVACVARVSSGPGITYPGVSVCLAMRFLCCFNRSLL